MLVRGRLAGGSGERGLLVIRRRFVDLIARRAPQGTVDLIGVGGRQTIVGSSLVGEGGGVGRREGGVGVAGRRNLSR